MLPTHCCSTLLILHYLPWFLFYPLIFFSRFPVHGAQEVPSQEEPFVFIWDAADLHFDSAVFRGKGLGLKVPSLGFRDRDSGGPCLAEAHWPS